MNSSNLPLTNTAGKAGSKKKQGAVAVKTSQISQLQKKHGVNGRYNQRGTNSNMQSLAGNGPLNQFSS